METLKRLASLARVGAIVLLALSASACANKELQDGAGLARGPATPGSQRDFVQNVGDIVYFTTDSTDLTPEAQQTLAGQARWLQQSGRSGIHAAGSSSRISSITRNASPSPSRTWER